MATRLPATQAHHGNDHSCAGARRPAAPTSPATTGTTQLSNQLRAAFNELLVSSLHAPRVAHDTEARIVTLAVEHLHADRASITERVRNGRLSTIAGSDPLVQRIEQLQEVLGEGPLLDSLGEATPVVAPDLLVDRRWPRWGASVADLGVRGVVIVRLEDHSATSRVLNLYSSAAHAFARPDVDLAQLYADQAAVAVRVTREVGHLNRAIDHRTVIGQAEGLLMEQFQIDADCAFAVLKRVSSHTNQKLHAVAADVVATRRLAALHLSPAGNEANGSRRR